MTEVREAYRVLDMNNETQTDGNGGAGKAACEECGRREHEVWCSLSTETPFEVPADEAWTVTTTVGVFRRSYAPGLTAERVVEEHNTRRMRGVGT